MLDGSVISILFPYSSCFGDIRYFFIEKGHHKVYLRIVSVIKRRVRWPVVFSHSRWNSNKHLIFVFVVLMVIWKTYLDWKRKSWGKMIVSVIQSKDLMNSCLYAMDGRVVRIFVFICFGGDMKNISWLKKEIKPPYWIAGDRLKHSESWQGVHQEAVCVWRWNIACLHLIFVWSRPSRL